ncbi:ALG6alpha-1,3-glucosyltransferase precursor [Aphelenchoides avenae]|nr:ALG6alpha-1,3-glucosyltransferase precursor [Aphelenchus avenae]
MRKPVRFPSEAVEYEVKEFNEKPLKFKDETHHLKTESKQRLDAQGRWYAELTALAVFVLLQVAISSGSYSGTFQSLCESPAWSSGYRKPPMHGDFEAQRHWMEITLHVPVSQWYFNTTDNDLDYWGLDYPPLTAYHSWLLGKVSHWLNPTWVQLHASRGIETPQHKLFMRASVFVTMTLLYAPVLLALMRAYSHRQDVPTLVPLLATLCYPGLLFVDDGHFQYNHIALGLFLAAVLCFRHSRTLLGSACFVLALNFKQMELYHSLPVFIFLLARSIPRKGGVCRNLGTAFTNVSKIGVVVVATFALLWLPFLFDVEQVKQVLHRLFPLARGVFECPTRALLDAPFAGGAVPSELGSQLPRVPRHLQPLLLHVLLPGAREVDSFRGNTRSAPNRRDADGNPVVSLDISLQVGDSLKVYVKEQFKFSLYPLCVKDGTPEILPLFLFYAFFVETLSGCSRKLTAAKWLSYLVIIGICVAQVVVPPPARYPHLFELLNAVFSFAQFGLFWLYANYRLFAWNYAATQSATTKKKKAE